jgi:hypothetical protein
LPESFRGGCSFGAGIKADLSRRGCLERGGGKHDLEQTVNALQHLSTGFTLSRQAHDPAADPAAQFLDTTIALV